MDVNAAVELLFALQSDSDSNNVPEQCSSVTATVSLRSVVLQVVTARSEKSDMEGDDDGTSEDSNGTGNTPVALCQTMTVTILLAIKIVSFPYQRITLKLMKLLALSKTRTGKVRQ